MKMYKIFSTIMLMAIAITTSTQMVMAKENIGQKPRTIQKNIKQRMADGCEAASKSVDLDINNVRARIQNGGDMWWDLVSTAKYEIPKVTEANQVRRTSLFAGALWIGGFSNNNLKLAAMTYRQNGSDFWPGPLDTVTATIDVNTCKEWDRMWELTRADIEAFRADPTHITDAIRTWPAHGNTAQGQSRYLAPFVDVDKDGKYIPENGDYPDVYGDQTIWYIYNDKGNIHSESQADAIGLELQTQAFAYATNDEINNMTFYTTTVTNRSKNQLDSTYFGQWVDPDLGYAFDDYVAVDTARSLGICYNGDNNDEGVTGYGTNPPSIGVDFFQGPKDAAGNELGMSYFVYYNNDFSTIGNPDKPIHFYYYLTGRWKNGEHIKYGGNGYNGGIGFTNKPANYMFPSDPREPLPAWSEVTAGNKPADRRFIQSAGPFSLKPGATNRVTVGVVWARATTGGATGSFDQLKIADDKAQRLYNNNFKLIDGPNAPDAKIRELDKKLIISLENTYSPKVELYRDTVINDLGKKVTYRFEGYQIFQLKNSSVSSDELDNPDKARLLAQVDVKNNVTKLVNRVFDPEIGAEKLIVKVVGGDEGIKHTFEVLTDRFASGDDKLVNFKFYYYTVVAYAVAEDPTEPTQYLAGRRNNKVYTGVPHPNAPEFGGTSLFSDYGDGPELTRIDGIGNGGRVLDLTEATERAIIEGSDEASKHPVYKGAKGPVNVKVYDPTQVKAGDYEIRFTDTSNPTDTLNSATARWYIVNKTTQDTIHSNYSLTADNEQLLVTSKIVDGKTITVPWGLAVTVKQPLGPGNPNFDLKNGFLEATMTFSNPSERWLSGVKDIEHADALGATTPTPGNWIRSGRYGNLGDAYDPKVNDASISISNVLREWMDPAQNYEGMLDGIIAPAALTARSDVAAGGNLTMGPIPKFMTAYTWPRLTELNSVDIIFTSDKSLWSRCMVWEMGEDPKLNEGGVEKFSLRDHAGWNGEVDAGSQPVYSTDPKDRGMSYFPGFAINVETGQRLNIFFGEDSHLDKENGADMIWNPTSNMYNTSAGFLDYINRYLWGGKHWIYVMNSIGGIANGKYAVAYDGCKSYVDLYRNNPKQSELFATFSSLMYVMEPVLADNMKLTSLKAGLIPNDVRIRLRVAKPYAVYKVGSAPNGGLPYYSFTTDGIAAQQNVASVGTSALDKINVVPNPYYAYSGYENSQLDNRVRITNVPSKSEISIYTLDGTLVRRINKDESASTAYKNDGPYPSTFIDWDLKNQKGIPVASGVYIIHINGYDLGEKVIKWFGIMRPIDLDTF